MKSISIADDFSEAPGARYYEDGPFSGQEFREKILNPAFENNDKIKILLDGTEGYATSFLEESFGGLSRIFGKEDVLKKISFISLEDPTLIDEIIQYIEEAK
ncbi:MAG: STAS-like domain-containing protein [Campylobacteraceae bacterium]|nr:STAS-like domain-containing protein [Campylobacteraceae bacterium]